jgi:hypothetical protein
VLLERLLWLLVGAAVSLVLAGYRRLDTPPSGGADDAGDAGDVDDAVDASDASLGRTALWTAVSVAVYGVAAGTLLYGVNQGSPLWVAAGFLAVEAVGFLAARRA